MVQALSCCWPWFKPHTAVNSPIMKRAPVPMTMSWVVIGSFYIAMTELILSPKVGPNRYSRSPCYCDRYFFLYFKCMTDTCSKELSSMQISELREGQCGLPVKSVKVQQLPSFWPQLQKSLCCYHVVFIELVIVQIIYWGLAPDQEYILLYIP